MKTFQYFLLALAVIQLSGCNSDSFDTRKFKIDGISTENYPKVDGSTSTAPLQLLIACKLLNCDYHWRQRLESDATWTLQPVYDSIPYTFFAERIKTSQTHNSFINLIDKKAEFILTARLLSPDEKAHADAAGVTLIETPVALDAFIFIVHPDNPVKSLTIKQIQDIYTGKITNWKVVGGSDSEIKPYIRNDNSGSQELMESLVMKGLEIPDWPQAIISSMMMAFTEVRNNPNAICYTLYYYKEQIVRDNENVKTLAIEGKNPQKSTIANKSYPLVSEVYAVINSQLKESTMAYKLYELIQTNAGQNVVAESGYIPVN